MNRILIPGRFNHCGQAVPDTQSELDCDIAPDAERTFSPSHLKMTPEERARDIFLAVAAAALLAFGLWIFPR